MNKEEFKKIVTYTKEIKINPDEEQLINCSANFIYHPNLMDGRIIGVEFIYKIEKLQKINVKD